MQKQTVPYCTQPLLLPLYMFAQRLADASSHVDGWETSGLGISRGHVIQSHGGPTFDKKKTRSL